MHFSNGKSDNLVMLHDLGALARRACCKGSRRASKRPPDAFPLNERPGLVGQQTSRSAAGFKRCKALLGRRMNRDMRGAGCAVSIRSLVVGSGGDVTSHIVLIQKSGTSFQNGPREIAQRKKRRSSSFWCGTLAPSSDTNGPLWTSGCVQ